MDVAQITQYFNLGLIVLFVLLVVGLLIAALRGLRRGIWKSTHNMIFMLSLIVIAFFTLDTLTEFIGNFDLSIFFKGSLYISRSSAEGTLTYWVPITTVKETLTEFFKGFYMMFNVAASPASAANFAIAIVSSGLKIILFIVDMILIVTIGNLLSFITWFLIFQHFIPRVARKVVKIRWAGMLETMVTFLVVTFLFFTPFTALVNSINQSYQHNRPKSDNETIVNIGNFVDAYNDSLFAKILFNWTVDESGMTLDTRLFDKLTTGVSGEYTIGLIGELANLTNAIMSAANGIKTTDDNQIGVDVPTLITKDIADTAFDVVINSGLITTIIPVVVEIALNSDLLESYIPARLVDLSDVEWDKEIGYVRDMVDSVFDSGVLDDMFYVNEEGATVARSLEGNDLCSFIENIVYSDNFYHVLDVFKSIDQSKVLSRAVPAVLSFVSSIDETGQLEQYLPLSWEEMNELSWGFETYILFDFLHATVTLDDDFLKAIFIKAGLYTPAENEECKPLAKLISEHASEFKALMVGQVDENGEPINVDKHGQTIVYQGGQRIKDGEKYRNYCLFDMNLVNKVAPKILDGLFEQEAMKDIKSKLNESDLDLFHETVSTLNGQNRVKNYKREFNSVLDVVATVARDEELIQSLVEGHGIDDLIKEEGNYFSIEVEHIDILQSAIAKMDKSDLLYSAVAPILKSLFLGDDIANALNDFGLKASVLASAIDHDMKKDTPTLFTDLSSLLDSWTDLGKIQSLSSKANDADSLMNEFKDRETVDAFVRVLSILTDNPIVNPTPQTGDEYSKNENLYGLLEFVFSNTKDMGLEINRSVLEQVEDHHTWNEEFAALGDIFYYIACHDIMNASSAFNDGLTRENLTDLRKNGKYDIPGLFKEIDNSYIFSESLGPFLDKMFSDSLSGFLIDKDANVSFSNITDWTAEGDNISNLLDSLYNLTPEDPEKAKTFLTDFDMKTLDKIVELNDMLHDLAHSGIFTYIDEDGISHFQFGKWLYDKIDSSMGSFTVDDNSYDLLADPKFTDDSLESWKASWGSRPGDDDNPDEYFLQWKNNYNADNSKTETHYIAYRDFVKINNMDNTDSRLPVFWCDYDNYQAARANFLSVHESDLTDTTTYLNNDWMAYFGSDDFVADYETVFEVDEISRVTKFMTYSMRIVQERVDGTKIPFNEVPTDLLDNVLTSLNETYCMRASIYNFYRIAADNVFNSYSDFTLTSAYNTYMIDADVEIGNFTDGRQLRQVELDKLMSFYRTIDDAKAKGIIVGNSFKYDKMNDDAFMSEMKTALQGLNDSYVFHRKGSSKQNQLTTFQGLFNHMLGESETKKIIFKENSPKDLHNVSEGIYTDATSKVRLLITDVFKPDNEIPAASLVDERNNQQEEVENLLDSIKYMYSLVDKNGQTVTNFNDADMTKSENTEKIHSLLTTLNASDMLYDLVPNTIYNMFIENDNFSIKNGGDEVNFKKVDPFYHYYYDGTIKRSSIDFTARYLNADIAGIDNLLTDYQNYNDAVGTGSITNKSTLKNLAGSLDSGDNFVSNGALADLLRDLHNCNMFHSPARHHDYASYYTNKFDGDNYTLFEEMMSKVCSFTKLDDFAYDSTYDVDVATYGSAANKLRAKIKAITLADDTSGAIAPYYHHEQGTAWNQEIHAVMKLAYTAANTGDPNAELDASSINLDTLAPSDVKDMLTAVNGSDLVADAVPGFVKKGFETINLGSRTTYSGNGVNYAYYRLDQEVYGGANALSGTGTEIDNIYNVMSALAQYDGDNNFTGYISNLTNMTDFVNGAGGAGDAAGLKGLMKFVYDSHIFNTSLAGNYNEYNYVDGQYITAQGVLLYNTLGNDLSAYVAREAHDLNDGPRVDKPAINKIASLSRITHMRPYDDGTYAHYTYEVEALGIKQLINLTDGNIDATTFTNSTSIDTVKAKKALILGIVECAYNATQETDESDYQRSAIASEFISGLFNTILENQYNKLYNSYPTYAYEVYSFGEDNANDLDFSDYASLSKVERDGLEGIIDSLDYTTGTTAFDIAANMQAHRSELKANFVKMGTTSGNNSHIAQTIYLSEAHNSFKQIAALPIYDSHHEHFQPVDETTKAHDVSNNVYSDTFSFAEYGERIETFLTEASI